MNPLRHRNIALVFHLGSERGEYFYAMELVDGDTIEDWVQPEARKRFVSVVCCTPRWVTKMSISLPNRTASISMS